MAPCLPLVAKLSSLLSEWLSSPSPRSPGLPVALVFSPLDVFMEYLDFHLMNIFSGALHCSSDLIYDTGIWRCIQADIWDLFCNLRV